jgi:hypothetical protein
MIIKLLKEDVFDTIQANIDKTHQLLKETNSPQMTLSRLSDSEYFFDDSIIEMDEFEFKMVAEKPSDSDFENARKLYEALRITPQQASDFRLWTGLAFTIGAQYLIYRWGLKDSKAIQYHWMFYTSNKRSLFYQGLSRLWWYTHITYNETLEDPYQYTRMVFDNNIRYVSYFIYRNLANSKKVRMAYLKYVNDLESKGFSINYDQVQTLIKNLGVLAGNQVIDSLSEQEIYTFLESIKLTN